MATRDNPYGAFNFMVQLGNAGGQDEIAAGFSDVSGLGNEVKYSEYRNGNEPHNHVRKMNGLNKASDVTFKRGSMGTLEAYALIDAVRNGAADPNTVITTMRVTLQGEDHKDLLTWTLSGARVVKYTCGPLNAKGTETMIEEMVVQYEELTMELESS